MITADDLAQYRSIIRDDNEVIYTKLSNGRKICGPPPPSSSAVTQAIIKILDGYQFDQVLLLNNIHFVRYLVHFYLLEVICWQC